MNNRLKQALDLLPPGQLEVSASEGSGFIEEDPPSNDGHYSIAGAPAVILPDRYADTHGLPAALYNRTGTDEYEV